MARSIPALVTPALLKWARERAGLQLIEAANRVDIHPTTLEEWEAGHEVPSIAQARKLGEVYRRPLAVFFLPEPPRDFDPQREFRRLPGVTLDNESPELRNALRVALYRRQAALAVYEATGEPVAQSSNTSRQRNRPKPTERNIRIRARYRDVDPATGRPFHEDTPFISTTFCAALLVGLGGSLGFAT